MKLWQIVIILHVLCGRAAFIGAETVYEVAEGGNITVGCWFNLNGHTKIFCKNDCDKEEDILVQTLENEECNGSYCIDYKYNGLFSADVMYVTITKVNRTDSGRYQSVVKRSGWIDGIHKFEIKVTNGNNGPLNPSYTLKPEPHVTLKPTADTSPSVQTGDDSFISVKTTPQSFTQEPDHNSTSSEHQPPKPSGTLLYLGGILIAIIVLSSAALFIFFRKKKSKDPPVRAERESVQEPHRLYEEIPDRGSPPVEMLTIYVTASAIRPTKDQPSDVYSLATASTNHLEAEDLTYSEVNYSNNSDCPQSRTQTTLYSAVQAQPDDSNYSTVFPPQQ